MQIFISWIILGFIYGGTIRHAEMHDLHLSRTEIQVDPASGDLQISMHIFVDDLDLALTKKFGKKFHTATEKESKDCDLYIERYLREVFKVQAGGGHLNYQYLGKEAEGEELAVWVYLEIPNPGKISQLTIEQKLLTELYSDQRNIIDIKSGKRRLGFVIMDNKTMVQSFKM